MASLPGRWLLFSHAAVQAAVAAVRLAWLYPRLPLDHLAARLRQGKPFAAHLAQPHAYELMVARLSPFLPPFGMGGCLKRSLLLLHLWARCGLSPRLHLGVRPQPGERPLGHAWLTLDDRASDLRPEDGAAFPACWTL